MVTGRITKEKPKDKPLWFFPNSPFGSAVRHIASVNPTALWVALRKKTGKKYQLLSSIGNKTKTKPGQTLFFDLEAIQVEIRTETKLERREIQQIEQTINELRELWSEQENRNQH
ncbi:MAG: hypothetical protein A3K03_07440 [Bdellovibrionales bacterium RIFOXYD1_FULL_44_7]|nr:MAG: hypothetical protein A3K03_07440 [Bdellovibrionales bacterium RIFOXYD1_FULL_44_7]